ncbi:MAG TPA: CARDB domain-containing protein, partial [Telluria sp.]|nr:CARDB domain-containing protein [Telluria sp.]
MRDRLFGKLGLVFALGLLTLLAPGSALADFPPTSVFPNTGAFVAHDLGDANHSARIELSGNYDKRLQNNAINIEPRTVVAKEFFRTHQDRYDFVVVFSNFEFETGDALAFHIGVQNKVKGLGIDEFDHTGYYGSAGRLQGYIDMAALSRYVTNPFDARFDHVLGVFAHEFLHQFAAKARFRLNGGEPSSALLGKDGSHWSFLLDSGASVEYGNQWRDNGNGSFTSVANRQFFSPLDLYLMGMNKKEEVPPFFLIQNSDIEAARMPANEVTITGSRLNLTIDDVVAAEGPRVPDAANAQKEFRLGFVLLSRPGSPPTNAQLIAMNNIRSAIANRMAVLTGGRMLAHSYLEPKTDVGGANPGNPGGAVRDGAANIGEAMAWLRGRQTGEGSWTDNQFTTMRDTAVAFDILSELDGAGFTGRQRALDWLRTQNNSNTDYLARQVRSMAAAGARPDALAARLVALQNSDGGWGLAPRYQSNPVDTALAVQALLPYESTLAAGKLEAAVAFLAARQNSDGGWGNLPAGASRTAVTASVLQALKGRAQALANSNRAIAYLATRQNPDGGFGDSSSTVHDSANVMAALLSQNALGNIRADQAIAYVAASQHTDGSWDGSAYSTALAVRLLKSSGLFNWTIGTLAALPAAPLDGQQTVLSFKVANGGSASAPAGIVRVHDGEPGNGGQQIGQDLNVPVLLPGESVELKLLWNTLDKAGAHTIVAQVDPGNTVAEASKSDNRTQLGVTVRPAVVPVELLVNVSDVVATPARPDKLPSTIAVSALVSNIGRTDALGVRVVLRDSAAQDAAIVDEKVVNLLGRTRQVVNFAATLTRPGKQTYVVVIDPDARVVENDKTNNSAAVNVETVASLDVEVRDSETVIARNPVYLGADAAFHATVRNNGTQGTPPFGVRYSVTNGTRTVVVGERVIQLAAGDMLEQDIAWRADMAGALQLRVELDPDLILAETDKSNNKATLPFTVVDVSGPNLSLSYKEFSTDPAVVLEGQPVVLSQLVHNSGSVTLTNVEVAFYDGDPAAKRLIGQLQTIASIAPGATVKVSTTWAPYPDAFDHLVFVVADPAGKVADVELGDNVAFMVLNAQTMTDLAVGTMSVTPELPKPTDSVSATVAVSNLGKQAAANVVVRAYEGDPKQGGVQVGADQVIANLAGLATEHVTFIYPAASGSRTLVIVVDPDNANAEKNKDNNIVRRELMAQDGNFA